MPPHVRRMRAPADSSAVPLALASRRLLQKLPQGNDFKFLREIRMEQAEESGE